MKVSEIFRSIQGEGRSQGMPCTFVRLAGCNLRCAWCDTPYALEGGSEMSVPEIEHRISSLGGRSLCITGGEPLLQGKGLLDLVQDCAKMGFRIEIETNGTIDFSPFQSYSSICMDVKCPSSGETSDLTLLPGISKEDGVKFVVRDTKDCEYAVGVMDTHPIAGEIFFSPVSGTAPGRIVDYIVERDLPVRFQLQLHKILGAR